MDKRARDLQFQVALPSEGFDSTRDNSLVKSISQHMAYLELR